MSKYGQNVQLNAEPFRALNSFSGHYFPTVTQSRQFAEAVNRNRRAKNCLGISSNRSLHMRMCISPFARPMLTAKSKPTEPEQTLKEITAGSMPHKSHRLRNHERTLREENGSATLDELMRWGYAESKGEASRKQENEPRCSSYAEFYKDTEAHARLRTTRSVVGRRMQHIGIASPAPFYQEFLPEDEAVSPVRARSKSPRAEPEKFPSLLLDVLKPESQFRLRRSKFMDSTPAPSVVRKPVKLPQEKNIVLLR